MASDGALRVTRDGPLATLTIDRPERRNAVDLATWRALPRVVARLADDPGVRVVIVRGTGRQAFSAGADLDDVAALVGRPDEGEAFLATVDAAVQALAELPVPTIAMIHGPCIGGGWELAAACDIDPARRAQAAEVPSAPPQPAPERPRPPPPRWTAPPRWPCGIAGGRCRGRTTRSR